MSKISVIIPAYNAEEYISEAIESVLNQTYKDLEIIVVDDGSTDNTAQQVGLKAEGSRLKGDIKYIYQENKGPGAARNRGIKEAKGEYIAFLDSDDLWMPEKLEKQMGKFRNNPEYGLIHTNRVRIEPDNSIRLSNNNFVPEGQVFDELLKRSFIYTSSVVVKKVCFNEIGLFNEDRNNRSEDYDLWLRMAYKHEFGFLQEPLIKYRVNPNGYNRCNINLAYDSEEKVFLKALEFCEGDKNSIKKQRLSNLMYRKGSSFYYSKDCKEAAKSFSTALRYKRSDLRSILFYLIAILRSLSGM